MNKQSSVCDEAVTPFIAGFSANIDKSKGVMQPTKASSIDEQGQMSALQCALMQFSHHGLADLNNANLMNRVDSKFLLPIDFLPDLLNQLTGFYSVLEINSQRVSTYHNQYFDTPQMAFYRDHHNGKLNRYKVRQRHYVDTDTQFLEVKFKNNQKRTLKSRIKLTGHESEPAARAAFIKTEMANTRHNLVVTQQGGYQRIALANEAEAERLTIDFNLWFKSTSGDNTIRLPGFFIAELKQNKKSKRSPFYQLMSRQNVFPTSFSKYCIGCALLYKSQVKTNQFKQTLTHIHKLNQPAEQPQNQPLTRLSPQKAFASLATQQKSN